MQEGLFSETPLFWLDHYRYHGTTVRASQKGWAAPVRIFAPAVRYRSPLWALFDAPLIERALDRGGDRRIELRTLLGRIIGAIRGWRRRACLQQLRELNDHTLRDIGLRREDFACEFPRPFLHCD
jgi:uncharacterized protein YjiS (DUF1127 family)